MTNTAENSSLEARRLALDELKERHDYELRTRELDLKSADTGWTSSWFTPMTTTILAGIVAAAGSVAVTLMQNQSSLTLERQKEQNELILKMISVTDPKVSSNNLKFLVESGLLDSALALRVENAKTTPFIPPPTTNSITTPQQFEAVQSDADIIKLVIAWEGAGFSPGPLNEGGAVNDGITQVELGAFLGRPASVDDVKNMSQDTITKFYLQRLQVAEGITVPMVRASFFNMAIWSGTTNAVRIYQSAAGQVLNTSVDTDGILGPASVNLINSVQSSDLLVETASCGLIAHLKASPAWQSFGPQWLARIRAFSPVKLRGNICADLPASTPDTDDSATDGNEPD